MASSSSRVKPAFQTIPTASTAQKVEEKPTEIKYSSQPTPVQATGLGSTRSDQFITARGGWPPPYLADRGLSSRARASTIAGSTAPKIAAPTKSTPSSAPVLHPDDSPVKKTIKYFERRTLPKAKPTVVRDGSESPINIKIKKISMPVIHVEEACKNPSRNKSLLETFLAEKECEKSMFLLVNTIGSNHALAKTKASSAVDKARYMTAESFLKMSGKKLAAIAKFDSVKIKSRDFKQFYKIRSDEIAALGNGDSLKKLTILSALRYLSGLENPAIKFSATDVEKIIDTMSLLKDASVQYGPRFEDAFLVMKPEIKMLLEEFPDLSSDFGKKLKELGRQLDKS